MQNKDWNIKEDPLFDKLNEYTIGRLNQIESGKEGGIKRKGVILSEETKQKISEQNKGRKIPYIKRTEFSQEHKEKLAEAGKGRVWSEESKKKVSESKITSYAIYEGEKYSLKELAKKLGYSENSKTIFKIKKGRIKDKWGITFL